MATRLLVWGLVVHLICDWMLQNDWMARCKSKFVVVYIRKRPRWHIYAPHPAAWVHASIHLVGLLLVFPWWMALALAVSHLIIDTRKPLVWWRATFRQTTDPANPASLHVAMWGDQVAHIMMLAVAALLLTH